MKLADLIAANHNLILTLPRFGIPLGFGDKTVQEVCSGRGLSVDFVLMVCNAYTFDDYQPPSSLLERCDMSMLVPYLKASHRYYLDNRLPHIERHLSRVADSSGGHVGEVLKRFYADYQAEVRSHFLFEEEHVFPQLEQLQHGIKPKAKMSDGFMSLHTNIEDALGDLPQIVYKYVPDNLQTDESIELVFDILQLSVDIEKHVVIEEKVLVPYVRILEGRIYEP